MRRTSIPRFVDVGQTRFETKIANMELYSGKRAQLNIEQVQDELTNLSSEKCKIEHEPGNPAHQGWCAGERVLFQLAVDKLRP